MINNKNSENEILNAANELENTNQTTVTQENSDFNMEEETGLNLEDFDREVELEQEFGNRPLQTAALSAGSELTFGLLDQFLTKTGIVAPDELREMIDRNPGASVTGSALGIIAPLIASGGTSALAKGVSKAGAGVVGASALQQATSKGISKLLKASAKDKFLASAAKKAAAEGLGSAAEVVPYAVGQTFREDALGTADFNAENLLSNVGAATAFAGGAGGLFGSAQALVPVIKNNKVVDYVQKKIKNVGDADKATWELVNKTPLKTQRLKDGRPQVYRNGKKFLTEEAKLTIKDKPIELFKKVKTATDSNGTKIGNTVRAIDKYAKKAELPNLLPTKRQWADDMIERLKGQLDNESLSVTSKKQNRLLNKQIDVLDNFGKQRGNMTANNYQKFKSDFQNKAKYGVRGEISFENELNRTMGRFLREDLIQLADNVSTTNSELGKQLRQANLNYGTGLEILEGLEKKVASEEFKKSFGSFKDFIFADVVTGVAGTVGGGLGTGAGLIAGKKLLESDFRRKAQILGSIERANKKTTSKINKSLENFFTKAKKVSVPTSTRILLGTSFDTEKPKKSKTRKEAFKRVRSELNDLVSNPEKMIEHVTRNNLRVTGSAPQTAQAIDQRMVKSINFLHSKLPKPSGQLGMIQSLTKSDKYQPSSLEIAKFERYVEGVENPLSALDDLQSGRLSREKVEAIREIYPNLYSRIQEQTMQYVTENADSISYPKRLQLGILLDIPADSTLIPQNIIKLQQTFTPEQDQPQPSGDLSAVDFADNTQSGTEKISTRE